MAQIWVMGEMLVEIMRPEPGTDLNVEGTFRGPFPSGAPAIFIDTVARLGYSAGLIGCVGKDGFGDALLERLSKDGVDCRFVSRSDTTSTGVAFVTYFKDGGRKFIFHMGNSAAVEAVCPEIRELGDMEYLHVMGCSLMGNPAFAQEILKLVDGVQKAGGKISFDPNIRGELLKDESVFEMVKSVLAHASVFLPGEEELLLISGEKTVEKAVESCFENPRLEVLALKKGSRGCSVYTRGEESPGLPGQTWKGKKSQRQVGQAWKGEESPGQPKQPWKGEESQRLRAQPWKGKVYSMGVYPVDAVDATGAGDCFDAAFICGLLKKCSIEETMKMAAAAGALNTAAFGPMEGNISPESIRQMMEAGG